ncbi:Ku DNA-binding complex, Ku70 subunit [Lindgomyces ingoldianus]|uniref:Ku DNA-binding complex, Ku70 subunit n=1 Tax=Lindgomyces ingoldianus TaxID=673940 RepID=A0ACB6RGY1_9PLEO|nr:Ku DNA-binding complex, Ku70 subunit [Lindgomyces ingoldianus]KAF2477577.1 Ku DNA-binding complex, Ku70 subunit [Lindgomyces ingoldianus]
MADLAHDNRPGDDEGEEEEVDDASYKTIKDAVLFAIDVSPSMLQRPPPSDDKKADRDSPTSAALKCAYQLMQQRIISNPTDMMGILLFGTEKTHLADGDNTFPHCYLLSDLDVPSANDVKQLRSLVENEEEAAALLRPADEPTSIAAVLFCAIQIFTTKAPNFSSRRLFLVTDNDNPAKIKQDKDTAITRARDLYDLGCTIDLFPISRPGHGFDRSKFYDDLVYPSSPSDPDAPASLPSATKVAKSGDGISLLQQLISSINSKATPRRALFSLPFEIGPGLRIGVKGFIIIKRQEHVKSCYVWVGGEKVQIVASSTSHLADDTARVVEKTELRKAYKFGGDTITFTPEEFTQIRQCFGDPVIRIIGFKPISSLPIWANTGKATFIYPSESDYVGSTRVFSALQQKLINSKKMAVAWFIARRNAAPVITAIIPGEEKYDEDGEQIMPPGLWLIPLPFVDDIRQCPEQADNIKTTEELTDIMRKVIEQLQLPKGVYNPSKYPNPDLQWFYRILQAMALEEEVPEKADDKTIPKYKQIDKRTRGYLAQFGQEFDEEHKRQTRGKLKSSAAPPKKRAATSSAPIEDSKPSKRIKTEPQANGNGGGMTDEDMAALSDRGNISKQSVGALKEFLKARKQPVAGKKIELIERVQQYLESKGL